MTDKTQGSDATTTLAALKADVAKFCSDRDWDQFHGAKDLAIGLVTEGSELLELFRFRTDDQVREILDSPETRSRIGAELSDSLFFVLRFAQRFDFDLSKVFRQKMTENSSKYPVERSRGKNAKYDELE